MIDGQRYTLYGLQTVKRLMTQATTGGEQGIRSEEWPELSDFNRRNKHEASVTIPVEMEDTLDLETEARSSVYLVCFWADLGGITLIMFTGAMSKHPRRCRVEEIPSAL